MLGGNGTIDVLGNTVSYSGDAAGVGGLTKIGSGTLIFSGANTYSGGTTIAAGTLQIGDGGTSGSVAGDVLDNGTLTFSRSDDITFSGLISGTGVVGKSGSGVLIFPSANSYSGGTGVFSGTLRVLDPNATGSGPLQNVATLDLAFSNAAFPEPVIGNGTNVVSGSNVVLTADDTAFAGAG